MGHAVAQSVEAPRYRSERRGSIPDGDVILPTETLTETSTWDVSWGKVQVNLGASTYWSPKILHRDRLTFTSFLQHTQHSQARVRSCSNNTCACVTLILGSNLCWLLGFYYSPHTGTVR